MKLFKKIFLTITLTIASLSLVGCGSDTNTESSGNLDGMLILQVYGIGEAGGTNSPALSHSFIELYNTTNQEIDLNGSSLQYSSGGDDWSYLALTGKVPAFSSYLVKANGYGDFTRREITNEDQSWNNVVIENKGIKVCLMDTTTRIAVANPFNVNGSPIVGMVDMLGATGSAEGDSIDGAEGNYAVGQSKQKAARRQSLNDTNNNNNDFGFVDYLNLPDSLMNMYFPKNSKSGSYDPFEGLTQGETNNDIVLFQVYGTGNNVDTPINRSFIELYNKSNNDISLDGYSLQYISETNTLIKLDLTGTIKAKSSFLIVGKIMSTGSTVNINITDNQADMVCDWEIDNKVFSVVLLSSTERLTSNNAFQSYLKGELDSYVDMLGVSSLYFEGNPLLELSKQKSARRLSLDDKNNNATDFGIIDYRLGKGLTLVELQKLAPKSTQNGQWSPFN